MRDDLNGKSIIVTGAGSGIGRDTATLAAQAGARVVVCDLREEAARETVSLITEQGGTAVVRQADVGDEAQVRALVDFAVETYGRIDGAHNNAGVEMRNKSVEDLTLEDWRFVQRVNVDGVFLCLKYVAQAMIATGGGSIVNTASIAGMRGQVNASDYVASKHAVVGLTKAAAIDLGPKGIRVNAVCPGLVMTPMAIGLVENPLFAPVVNKLLERHSIGRFGQPNEIAEAVVWLLSDRASFVNGLPMAVDGGYSTH